MHDPIWPNFELIRDIIVVLVICIIEEYPIKHKGHRVAKIIYVDFSDAESRTDNAVVSSGISPIFELIHACT